MAATTNPGAERGVDYMRYLRIVLERKGLFVTIALTVMLISVVVCYVLPKKYKAESIVFIEQNVISDLVKGIAITPSMDMKIKAIKVTMLSRSMVLDVIKALDLDVHEKSDAALDRLIQHLQNTIKITLDERRGVFKIDYYDHDPVLARDIVNTLTRLYIEENTSTKRKESYEATKFLAEQIKVFKKRIDDVEVEIDKFKSDAGLILSSNEPTLRQEIEDAQNSLDELQIRENALQTQRRLLLRNTPLRRQLENQTTQLEQLLTRYTRNHPAVRLLENSIAETRQLLKSKGNAELEAVYRTSEYQSVKVELASLVKTRESLEAELAKNRDILRRIPSMRTQLAELERKKQNEVIIYEQLVSRYGQSEVSKEMELQDKALSFRVLDPAVVPAVPSSPKRPLILLGGVFGGIALAFGVIVLLDLINPSIKSVEDLREFGVPILAIVPKIRDDAEAARRRRADLRVYVFGGLGFCIILAFLGVEVLHLGIVDKIIAKIQAAL